MEKPWKIESIYELQYFNCPVCVFKDQSKQGLINHAYENHPDCINYLEKITDDSLSDVLLPWMFHFPDEVLLKIFGYLNSEDIVKKISKVSQRFEILSKDQSLLKKMVFWNQDCKDESMLDALKRSKNLNQLSFAACEEPNSTILLKIAFNHCPKITAINVDFGVIYGTSFLSYIIKHGKNIESLTINRSLIIIPKCIYPEPFEKLKNLRKLCFRAFHIPRRQKHLRCLLKVLAYSCENLEELTIHGWEIQIEYLLTFLANSKCTLKNLSVWSVSGNGTGNFRIFHDLLGKCKNMESLEIRSDFMYQLENIATFISAISNMKNLTRLQVRQSYPLKKAVSTNDIIALFNGDHFENLKVLDLDLDISDESIKHNGFEVIEAIDKGCPNLEDLKLNFPEIEFVNRRIVYCDVCERCHLKNRIYFENISRKCPYIDYFTDSYNLNTLFG